MKRNFDEPIEEARADAQQLQAELEAAGVKHHAAIRAAALDVAAEADQLARTLKAALGGEEAAVREDLQAARSLFEHIAREAQELDVADEAELKRCNAAAVQKVRAAVTHLSSALSKKRAS